MTTEEVLTDSTITKTKTNTNTSIINISITVKVIINPTIITTEIKEIKEISETIEIIEIKETREIEGIIVIEEMMMTTIIDTEEIAHLVEVIMEIIEGETAVPL